ncbi:hypothetical protein E2C01_087319 [Portunus trituberculatus]|uniref:Uncharacterized protein n=1 Tax=Portunus trituberculatus TaxID=210409 RepID=A0A5B7J6A2_PORTR|nr:hypothetical protein [Portunus trituberculatus]
MRRCHLPSRWPSLHVSALCAGFRQRLNSFLIHARSTTTSITSAAKRAILHRHARSSLPPITSMHL